MTTNDIHNLLKDGLSKIRYCEGVIPCPGKYCAIDGESFFPGGKGHGREFPVGGVMYLGHNFDKLSGFEQSVRRGREENLTWRKIRAAVLPFVNAESIWFTNYFMGVLDKTTNLGPVERLSDFAEYEESCWEFLKLQIALQRPKVVVVLGKETVKALASSNRLDVNAWRQADANPFGKLRFKAELLKLKPLGLHGEAHWVPAYHPSYGRDNAKEAELRRDSEYVASLLKS